MTLANRFASLAAALFFLVAAPAAGAASAAAGLETQTSSAGGVTVKVTPKNIAGDTTTWEFAVVFDTHSQDLSDDLLKSAMLLDPEGKQNAPIAWEGAAPGGHHREGVLRFKALLPRPQAIELQITRPGETAARSFHWQLK